MPKNEKNFTVSSVEVMSDGKHADRGKGRVPGLYLYVRGNSRIWLFRYSLNIKAYTMGLGPLAHVGLADARAKATELRAMLAKGVNPADAVETTPAAKPATTFRNDTLAYYDHHWREWDAVHAALWMQSMENHVFRAIGEKDTATLTVSDIVGVLKPLWHSKHETAMRLHGRIRKVIEHAIDTDDDNRFEHGNPADRALKRLPRGVATKPEPHQALPWQNAPALYKRLCEIDDRAAYALRFLLVCCTPRAAEVIGAKWGEIDLKDGPLGEVFHVPACRMKSGKARDIPLPMLALELLAAIRPATAAPDHYIFTANRKGRIINDTYVSFAGHMQDDAMMELLRDLQVSSTVHGLRSTFRTWVSNHAHSVQDHDAAEIALDHVIGNRVHRSYDRADMLIQRRDLAERWTSFLAT